MLSVEKLRDLGPARKKEILSRSSVSFPNVLKETVQILERLRADPISEALREYGPARKNLTPSDFKVTEEEKESALKSLDPALKDALQRAAANIESFHRGILDPPLRYAASPQGTVLGKITRPIGRVGVYIPGGRAPYPSSALMNVIPAKVAGVPLIVAATPPGPDFAARPEIVAAAVIAGATDIYKLGGAWAIGAMAYGLIGVPKVDKIVGPGSSWVTAAKMAVFGEVDIDAPAGPSEGFIVSDGSAPRAFILWDFLAQLEHDPQAAAALVTTSADEALYLERAVAAMTPKLARGNIVRESLGNAALLLADDLDECFEFANLYAPEHLQISVKNASQYLDRVQSAGSIFLGHFSPIAAGDYATGPNHVLPTGGHARAFSGLSAESFQKKISFQEVSREGLELLARAVTTIATAEGLECHAKSVSVRLAKDGDE
ncbi:MAG: histidinol dehydrogenase [Deltaproteobacteria bacterium]|jgi:histidinol dehydrogenase|nr:histidinol dehydrogenase [Deltaproteobacteria bacterium]